MYTTGSAPKGRPSYDGLMLFKIELLRVWYGLRDEGVEEMVNDRISFSRFVGLSLAVPAPDSTTVLRLRRTMAEAGELDQVLRFGCKRHTVTDPNGMLLAEETTAANSSDTRHFEGPLRRAGLPRGSLWPTTKKTKAEPEARG